MLTLYIGSVFVFLAKKMEVSRIKNLLITFKETIFSSLPLAAIVLLVCVFIAPLADPADYLKLLIGYLAVTVGQTLFLVGLESSILPIGKIVGQSLIKLKNLWLIVLCGIVFGFVVTVAEPALEVLARQTHLVLDAVDIHAFVWLASAGTGLSVGFALLRLMKNWSIKKIFALAYAFVFAMILIVPEEFVGLAFDASGATTGDVSVPFILALGIGVSQTLSKRKSNDETFGIIGITSIGPIIAIFLYGLYLFISRQGNLPLNDIYDPAISGGFMSILQDNVVAVALALLPVLLAFIPFQIFIVKLPRQKFIHLMLGAILVYFGLLVFLSGIDYGFAFAGKYIGEVFLDPARPSWFRYILLIISFFLGMAITLSEPAVTVLGDQLEELTNGHIKKMTIRLTLALGIGCAVVLSVVKILTGINILFFLAPLYLVAVLLMKPSSQLFTSLAFDSGGVTGGALTSAFLTPLTLGIAQAVALQDPANAQSVLTNGFGIIAFISVTPLIAVQVLGILYESRAAKQEAQDIADEKFHLAELMEEEGE
ncbi:DUF1538 domain-containing protein [Enterococcus nangangensis]|uniref:DUF1538 domain-containing protein n=1 Tax=Enterococcus nangangensis TaxID=2559926 RepID=UPI001BB24637|nr:DUF1538 domain-containing protein [Enterococcus nangangensis]